MKTPFSPITGQDIYLGVNVANGSYAYDEYSIKAELIEEAVKRIAVALKGK